LLPFEVMTGLDVCTVRKQYPRLQIIGGIEKHYAGSSSRRLSLSYQACDLIILVYNELSQTDFPVI